MSRPGRTRLPALLLAVTTVLTACTGGPAPRADERPGGRETPADGVVLERFVRTLGPGVTLRGAVLRVRPGAGVRVAAVHGADLAEAETVRSMARRAHAVAAVNASYFDIADGPSFGGFAGDPLGAYVSAGDLLSEAARGRTALILPGPGGGPPRIAELTSRSAVRAADGARRTVDGIDRLPGRILGCGGVGGDRRPGGSATVTRPLHNTLCIDDDEIVDFRPAWGAASPLGPPGSVEAVLDRDGLVLERRTPAGGSIPPQGRTLYGIGEGADWLTAHARVGSPLRVTSTLTDGGGRPVRGAGLSVIGAGPGLLRDGRTTIDLDVNGMSRAGLDRRDPRTVVGIQADGTLLLVTLDGRQPGVSEGATLPEAADIVRELGAVDAMNLDGGGSTTMVVGGRVRNRPTDRPGGPEVERRVATALAVVPAH